MWVVAQAQLDRLWTCLDQVIRQDERHRGLGPTAVGLQCGGRDLFAFQRDLQAGIRDGVCLQADRVLIVRTPANPGIGLALKALMGGASAVVPHQRIAIAEVTAIDIVKAAPPGWSLIGDLDFLRLTTRSGAIWHWLDWVSLRGQEQKFLASVEKFRDLLQVSTSGGADVSVGSTEVSSQSAVLFCRHCGAKLAVEGASYCGQCGGQVSHS
jgi:hypothetical protein